MVQEFTFLLEWDFFRSPNSLNSFSTSLKSSLTIIAAGVAKDSKSSRDVTKFMLLLLDEPNETWKEVIPKVEVKEKNLSHIFRSLEDLVDYLEKSWKPPLADDQRIQELEDFILQEKSSHLFILSKISPDVLVQRLGSRIDQDNVTFLRLPNSLMQETDEINEDIQVQVSVTRLQSTMVEKVFRKTIGKVYLRLPSSDFNRQTTLTFKAIPMTFNPAMVCHDISILFMGNEICEKEGVNQPKHWTLDVLELINVKGICQSLVTGFSIILSPDESVNIAEHQVVIEYLLEKGVAIHAVCKLDFKTHPILLMPTKEGNLLMKSLLPKELAFSSLPKNKMPELPHFESSLIRRGMDQIPTSERYDPYVWDTKMVESLHAEISHPSFGKNNNGGDAKKKSSGAQRGTARGGRGGRARGSGNKFIKNPVAVVEKK